MGIASAATAEARVAQRERRLVIGASMLGTVFEWYDFFVYGTLAALLGAKFFPTSDPTIALLASLATFGAGFVVRPIGAVVFGYLGDRIGRKYTFLITITLMGVATAAVGVLPEYAAAGVWAPVLLVLLRLIQGLALGGEYGGAVVYVAEHAPPGRRGFYTSWIQAAVAGGFLLSLAVVLACQGSMSEFDFNAWGWRIPFIASLLLLAISLFIRLRLSESPVFEAMKAAGRVSRNPLRDSFASAGNTRRVLVALFGVAAGFTVIWYTSQFFALFFLQQTLQVDSTTSRVLLALVALVSFPLMILSGWLSDRIGRKRMLVIGYVLTLVALFPLFKMLAHAGNPALMHASEFSPVLVTGKACDYDVFASTQQTACAQALDFLSKRGVSYLKTSVESGPDVVIQVGERHVTGFDAQAYVELLRAAGYPDRADAAGIDRVQIVLILVVVCALAAMTYGPAGALLVELFPPQIRYTSLSVPYHIGTGYFGGLLPFVTQYLTVKSGDLFAGLWYPFAVIVMALVVSLLFLPETRGAEHGIGDGEF